MSLHFDEKGKYYTQVISKRMMSVLIQTRREFIRGEVHVRTDYRLKDELNEQEQFIAITNATVYDSNQVELYRTKFLALNRGQIVWVILEEEIVAQS
ncbi:MAG: hypothetical protein PHD58_05305 [Anaerolineales bacterium]|nr:hypothetical protein [Anaerolineales bacterium]